jgi:hypothetical protein
MQALVRFYADYRIKQHASLRLLRNRLIFLFSALMPYSQGGMVIALATLSSIYKINKINPLFLFILAKTVFQFLKKTNKKYGMLEAIIIN